MYFTKPARHILSLLATLKDSPYERPIKALVAAVLMNKHNLSKLADTANSEVKPVFFDYYNEQLATLTVQHIKHHILLNLPAEIKLLACTWPFIYIRHRNNFYYYHRIKKLFLTLNTKNFCQQNFNNDNTVNYRCHLGEHNNIIKINDALTTKQLILLATLLPTDRDLSYSTPFLQIKQELYWQLNQLLNDSSERSCLDQRNLFCYLLDLKPHFLNLQRLIILNFNTDNKANQLSASLLKIKNTPLALHYLNIIEQQTASLKRENAMQIFGACAPDALQTLLLFCQALSPEKFHQYRKKIFLENTKIFTDAIAHFPIIILVGLFGLAETKDERAFANMLRQCAHQVSLKAWADLFRFYPKFINLVGPNALLWLKNQTNLSWLSCKLKAVLTADGDKKIALMLALYQVLFSLLFHKKKLCQWVNADFITQLGQQETITPHGVAIAASPPLVLLIKLCPALIYEILAQKPELADNIPDHIFYHPWEHLSGESIFTQLIMQFFDTNFKLAKNPIFLLLTNNETLRANIRYDILFERCYYPISAEFYITYTPFGVLLVAKNMAGLDALRDMLNNKALCAALTIDDLLFEQTYLDNYGESFTIYDYLCSDEMNKLDCDDAEAKRIASLRNQKKQQLLALLKNHRPDLLAACAAKLHASPNHELSL